MASTCKWPTSNAGRLHSLQVRPIGCNAALTCGEKPPCIKLGHVQLLLSACPHPQRPRLKPAPAQHQVCCYHLPESLALQTIVGRAGCPLGEGMYEALSEPVEAWHFDFMDPPTSSEKKHLDLTFTAEGRFNAVLFWYTLHLGGGIELSTGPAAVKSGEHSLQCSSIHVLFTVTRSGITTFPGARVCNASRSSKRPSAPASCDLVHQSAYLSPPQQSSCGLNAKACRLPLLCRSSPCHDAADCRQPEGACVASLPAFCMTKHCCHAGLKTLGPALQYIAGELPVGTGEVLPLLATHNTVRALCSQLKGINVVLDADLVHNPYEDHTPASCYRCSCC